MALTQDSKEQRLKALTRLALATREKVDAATYVLYVEATAGFQSAVVVDACHRLETSVSWFPKLAELVDECRIVAKRRQEEQEEARRSLPQAPADAARLAKFLEELKAVARKKVMR